MYLGLTVSIPVNFSLTLAFTKKTASMGMTDVTGFFIKILSVFGMEKPHFMLCAIIYFILNQFIVMQETMLSGNFPHSIQ